VLQIRLRVMCRRLLFIGDLTCFLILVGEGLMRVLGRNGLNGTPLKEQSSHAVIPKYRGQRVRRTRLQAALIAKVPEGVIKLRKRLLSLENLDGEGARLVFEDGEEVVADLVIGGDGIRSVGIPRPSAHHL